MSSIKSSFLFVSLVLTIFAVNYCQAEDDPQNMKHFFNAALKESDTKCLEEAGLTKDDLKEMFDNPKKEPSAKHMCFVKCLFTASGLIDKNGMIAGDVVKKNAAPELDEATVNTAIKCMEGAGKISTCDDMTKLKKCIP